ncbi:MAG: DUF499 domain-containing protein [Actinomycetota bacterium]|nr:DUF499 domain-containing protein [Actinomycetota bacterium]
MATKLTPWWQAMPLRQEIRDADGSIDDVTMSLYNAVYSKTVPYKDPVYYGEITHPSVNLADLLAKVAVRLAGPGDTYLRAPALRRLDQAMGGGKSHGLIGLFHMAAHPVEFASTDIGKATFAAAAKVAGAALPKDLNSPKVVVLCCDDMVPGQPKKFEDGPTETMWERMLWRLFDGDMGRIAEFGPHYSDKSTIAEALTAVGRPVLILVDEILDYVRQLSRGDIEDLRTKDMGFLKALFDTVNDVRNCAMVVVMIDSETDPMSLSGPAQADRAELESGLQRNGTPATVTANTDFVAILRRRLFSKDPTAAAVRGVTELLDAAATGAWKNSVFTHLYKNGRDAFAAEVDRCYPFHPDLIRIIEEEWSVLAGYQKVRSTIRIFAAAANAQAARAERREWAPALIGPGDLVLSDSAVREAIIGSGLISDPKNQSNYRGIAENDVVDGSDTKGSARELDLARAQEATAPFVAANPRASERASTALFLYSVVGTRAGGRLGATENELKAASFVPDSSFAHSDAEALLEELCDKDRGLAAIEERAGTGGLPKRYFLSSKQTLPLWFRSMRASVTAADRDNAIRDLIDSVIREQNASGPFAIARLLRVHGSDTPMAALSLPFTTSDKDLYLDVPKTRLLALDHALFSLGNGDEADTLNAIRHVTGTGSKGLAVQWSASLVFAVGNTQARKVARAAATDLVAWQRVAEIDQVRSDEDLISKVDAEIRKYTSDLRRKVSQMYQHVAYLAPGDDEGAKVLKMLRLDQAVESALSGATVWSKLREEDRAVGRGEFGAKALKANLDSKDYGVPLDEVRNRFWQTVRKPLLWGGDSDLRTAIFEAIRAEDLRIVGAKDSEDREVTAAGDIQFLASLHLAAPKHVEPAPAPLGDETPGGGGTTPKPEDGGGAPIPKPPVQPDAQVSLSLTASLSDAAKREAVWRALDELARGVDDGVASHIQISLKVTGPRSWADELKQKGADAGMAGDVREL